jgi:hypothetical protein
MKAIARISSNNGHMVLPAAGALFGSLPGKGAPRADESVQGWHARAGRVMRKEMGSSTLAVGKGGRFAV